MGERILTQHPNPDKQGVNISKRKYETIRSKIIEYLHRHGETTFQNLINEISRELKGSFNGSIPWYVTTVKLDLEGREIIERIPNSSPQRLRLTNK